MTEDITRLDSPIDVMYLMHKAMRADTAKAEAKLAEAVEGADMQPFIDAFGFWAKELLYHATAEDKYMTTPLTNSQPARDNEAEHAELAQKAGAAVELAEKGDVGGFEQTVKDAMLSVSEKQHEELSERMDDVMGVLQREIGDERMAARARRHLYQKIVELRILENDHLENEEAFVLPVVREQMTEAEELEVARRLLIDEDAEDPKWIIEWVRSELAPGEKQLLDALEKRFAPGVAA